MEEIPDAWPPTDGAESGPGRPPLTVPLFPLRGVYLLPRQILPLHVFEPRYRQMIDDVLDAQGRLAIGTMRDGQESIQQENEGEFEPQAPEIHSIAGVGEIARHEKTPDGRYFLWLFGLGRFDVEEVPSDRPYRRVRATPIEEIEPIPEVANELAEELRRALDARSEQPLGLPPEVPVGLLADALAQKLQLPGSAMEPIFSERDIERRARMTLKAHEAFPPPDLG